MTEQAHSVWVPPPDVELVVTDSSLPLELVEPFAAEYSTSTAAAVKLRLSWGGPAAGGIGWGGPEIAVIIVIGELLRRGTSEAYDLTKAFVVSIYHKIRTRNGARWYIDGAMALGVDNDDSSTKLLFCFPEGLSKNEVEEKIKLVEQHQERLLVEFAEAGRKEVRLCWHEDEQQWLECQPAPEGQKPLDLMGV